MLQALNILENFDLKGMGFNSTRYIHTVYQAMSLAFCRPRFLLRRSLFLERPADEGPVVEGICPAAGALIRPDRNDPGIGPGDPIPSKAGKSFWQK